MTKLSLTLSIGMITALHGINFFPTTYSYTSISADRLSKLEQNLKEAKNKAEWNILYGSLCAAIAGVSIAEKEKIVPGAILFTALSFINAYLFYQRKNEQEDIATEIEELKKLVYSLEKTTLETFLNMPQTTTSQQEPEK